MSNESLPRITGTEMEYPAFVRYYGTDNEFKQPEKELVTNKLISTLPEGVVAMNSFLTNGARYYQDSGCHAEYSGPENRSFKGTVTCEIAGERIFAGTLEALRQEGYFQSYRLYKRLVDDNGTTWGHHENYLGDASRISISAGGLALLGLHLATRNIWAGAGYFLSQGGINTFRISQKTSDLNTDYGEGTTGKNKPLVNLRNQPMADTERFVRVHVTSGDANISPWATWMSLGTTSVVLRLIENGADVGNMETVLGVLSIAKQVCSDPSLTRLYTLYNKRREQVTAIDLQWMLFDLVQEYKSKIDFPGEELQIIDEWERVLDDLTNDPLSTADRVGWIARRQLLLDYCDKNGWSYNHPGLIKLDKVWDELSSRGFAVKLRQSSWKEWMPSEATIKTAITSPPKDTRAAARADFIKTHYGKDGYYVSDWEQLGYYGATSVTKLSDPYSNSLRKAA